MCKSCFEWCLFTALCPITKYFFEIAWSEAMHYNFTKLEGNSLSFSEFFHTMRGVPREMNSFSLFLQKMD